MFTALLILTIWLLAAFAAAYLWSCLCGTPIKNWPSFFRELGSALLDIACQLYLDITERLPWRRKKEIRLDEFEKELS